ncbi:MAG: isoprenyl transferase [Vulcanimicrobiaceae bacterium]
MISRTATQPHVDAVPRHVAIIMDGNRRWARARGLPSVDGHRAGAIALRATVEAAARIGLECLTVYAFSEENWRRDVAEVGLLMELVRHFAEREAAELARKNVCVRAIGRTAGLPAATRVAVETLVAATAHCRGMRLNLALNYGARTELCDAIKALAIDVKGGKLAPEAIDDDSVAKYLYTAGLPDPDLLIRTGGELRVSNFLLYQIAYAELWATTTPWPDFDEALLRHALAEYASRQRRFGS